MPAPLPRPFMPPRPFPPNSRPGRQQLAAKPAQRSRLGTAPVTSLRQISSEMNAKKETSKPRQKRPTTHLRSRPPPRKPGQNPPSKPPGDDGESSPKLQFRDDAQEVTNSDNLPGSAREKDNSSSPAKAASVQVQATPTSQGCSENASSRRKKFVSFRSTDSIVPDGDDKVESVSQHENHCRHLVVAAAV